MKRVKTVGWVGSGLGLFVLAAAPRCAEVLAQCGETKPVAQATRSCCSGSGATTSGEVGTGLAKSDSDESLWMQHVQTLANPAWEGREPGTRGIEQAAEYIEYYLKSYGLAPAFTAEGGSQSFRQPVSFDIAAGPETATSGTLSIAGEQRIAGEDFVMTSIAGERSASGPVAFVGYGLNQGPSEYSSFDAKTDLSGKIALLLRLEPLSENGAFLWGSGPGQHSSMIAKLSAVAARGAAGILIVNPPGAKHELPDLDTLASAGSCCSGAPRLPTAMISPATAESLLRQADPKARDLMTWRRLADEGKVGTVELRPGVIVNLTAQVKARTVRTDNVAGALSGKGALADQWLVIGGHYDHVGRGLPGRADPTDQGILLGADDNASGTAMVLLLAKRLSEAYAKAPADANLRSVLFVAFTAEERGLIGSRHFTQYAPMSLGTIHAMLNLDAVGRLRDDTLWLYGYGTANEFPELVGPLLVESGLKVMTEAGSHSSDQVSFQEAGIPVLFANTGGHSEYHTSRDTASTVNPIGAAKVLQFAENVAVRLASMSGRLTYQEQETTGTSCGASSSSSCGGSGSSCCGQSPPSDGATKSKCCG